MDYSDSSDFATMQQEAIRRVHEMQQRSKSIVNNSAASKAAHEQASAQSVGNKSKSDNTSPPLGGLLDSILSGTSSSKELFNFNGIKIDEEKALIGLLIYILYKNGSDVKLLLALGYLLL